MFRRLDDKVLVSGQIGRKEVAEARRHGVTAIVNNRPDGEDPGQPAGAEIAEAAEDAGIVYRHQPIARGIGPAEVAAMRQALAEAGDGKLLLFCRSGTRSTLAWALARSEEGLARSEIEAAARQAGVDLRPIDHLL